MHLQLIKNCSFIFKVVKIVLSKMYGMLRFLPQTAQQILFILTFLELTENIL